MIRNYLKITLRNLLKHKGYAAINVVGLAIGMAACFLMVLFVQHERSYDRFHEHADRIARVNFIVDAGSAHYDLADAPAPVGPAMQEEFPEVQAVARLKDPGATLVAHGDLRFNEERFYFASPGFFEVFSFPLLRGDRATALREPFTVLLTESTARKYFGDADPIGQTLRVNDARTLTITGVLADPPSNTHVPFDLLASFGSLQELEGAQLEEWGSVAKYYTYLLLAPGQSLDGLEAKLPGLVEQHLPVENFAFSLQPLTDIHLRSNLGNELEANGDVRYVYLFSAIAVFILLLACINYMNLATARATMRVREVGMRKVLGAHRVQLIRQFLGESFLFGTLALLLALSLVEVFLPILNDLTERSITLSYTDNVGVVATLAVLVLVVGVVAGSYPAFVLSGFRPAEVLKGTRQRESGALLRKVLVVGQFTISTVLLIGTVVIYQQMRYVQQKKLGFDAEQVVVIPLQDAAMQQRYEVLKRLLRQDPSVVQVTASSDMPTGGYGAYFVRPEGAPDDEPVILPFYAVDYDFFETLGLDVVQGRAFSPDLPTDSLEALVINETAVQQFGWDDPLGKQIRLSSNNTGTVIGVVKDFHFTSLREAMRPVAFRVQPELFQYVAARIRPGNVAQSLAHLERAWQQFAPAYPFEYDFLDEDIGALYASEQRLGQAVTYFAGLAIFIACLGLFGLAAFTAERRTKEIGIRKVMGASVPRIVVLVSTDFVRLVLLAFVVAAPLAYVALQRWLDTFAYRIDLSWPIFLLAGALALAVALLTVSYQSIRAALADPVESLRYE